MTAHINLKPTSTYATQSNAIKAVCKAYPPNMEVNANLRYITKQRDDGRWYPVFLGQAAIVRGVHFNFCVVG